MIRLLHASALLCLLVLPKARADQRLEHFEKNVRPLLLSRCIKCHGPEKHKGGLRLDSASGWQQGGDSGPALQPGKASDSRLIKAIGYEDRDLKMPPDGKLSETEIEALRLWVAAGAVDPRQEAAASTQPKATSPAKSDHWAFKLPQRVAPPPVKDAEWPRNDLDRFILHKLEAAGIPPAPDAAPEVLARRLSYDLTGLPNPPQSTTVTVDELMAGSGFAERWGQHWLDGARFAESSGGGRTLPFNDAWRYRDYVLESIKADVPLNRFITEQIAGDLMPYDDAATRRRQLTATGYLVLGAHNYEEQDKELLRMDIVDEQLDTIGKSLLGMTISCARCHDHKFDPIPARDYYALAGILRSSKLIRDPKENVAHWIDAPLPLDGDDETKMRQQEEKISALKDELAVAKKDFKRLTPKREPKDGKQRPLAIDEVPGIVVDDSAAAKVGEWTTSTRYPTYVGEGYLHDQDKPKGELSLTFIPKLPKPGRYEVRFSYTSTVGRATNVPVNILHADGETEIKVDESTVPPIDGRFVSLGVYRFEATGQGFVLVANEGTDGVVTADAVTFIPEEDLTRLADAEDSKLAAENPAIAAASARVKSLEKSLKALEQEMGTRPTVMALQDHEQIGDCAIHIRGSIRNLGEIAPRGFLEAAFHEKEKPKFDSNQSGRLQLAAWLTSNNNPLTARVLVNRVWMHLMGEGIVRTVDNFGITGDAPSHPELLDHLALYLQDHDWSLKALVRYIISSRTYQMASRSQQHAADPDNRLVHCQRRRRLDANALRDTILSAAGNLDLTWLGPNIKAAIKVTDSNDTKLLNLEYGYVFEDTRRSVYTPAFRNKRHELFDVFDFNDINQSLGRRNTSTVSPQALYMLNGDFVVGASRLTAERLLADRSLQSQSQRLSYLARLLLGRAATPDEMARSEVFLGSQSALDDWAMLVQAFIASPDFRYLE